MESRVVGSTSTFLKTDGYDKVHRCGWRQHCDLLRAEKTESTTKFVGDASCVPLDCLRLMNALLGPCPGAEACEVRFEVSILGEVRRQHGFLDQVPMVPALGLMIILVVTTCTQNCVNSQCRSAKHGFEPATIVFSPV